VTYPKVGSSLNPIGTITAPFEVWNITTNTKVNAAIFVIVVHPVLTGMIMIEFS